MVIIRCVGKTSTAPSTCFPVCAGRSTFELRVHWCFSPLGMSGKLDATLVARNFNLNWPFPTLKLPRLEMLQVTSPSLPHPCLTPTAALITPYSINRLLIGALPCAWDPWIADMIVRRFLPSRCLPQPLNLGGGPLPNSAQDGPVSIRLRCGLRRSARMLLQAIRNAIAYQDPLLPLQGSTEAIEPRPKNGAMHLCGDPTMLDLPRNDLLAAQSIASLVLVLA